MPDSFKRFSSDGPNGASGHLVATVEMHGDVAHCEEGDTVLEVSRADPGNDEDFPIGLHLEVGAALFTVGLTVGLARSAAAALLAQIAQYEDVRHAVIAGDA